MNTKTPNFLSEVFVSHAATASWVSREIKKGTIRKLGSRVYTKNLKEDPEILVRRHAWFLVEELFPGALITDRTALEHRPATDGSIFVISKKKRPHVLPGLSIHPRKGPDPLPEDKPFMDGLYLACPARAFLENMRQSRARKNAVSRTLPRRNIEEKLETILRSAGIHALQTLRDEARNISLILHLEKEFKALDAIIGTLLGTRKAPILSPITAARVQGEPYDPQRLDLFQKLYVALSSTFTEIRTITQEGPALSFFEAYFSNFIEGTEFGIDEAENIIFSGKIPKDRPKDAHDIIGTYRIASNRDEMTRIPQNADQLILLLKHRHALLMQGRPEVRPGEFKTEPNQAGSTFFVDPTLVEGTLRKGFKWLQALNTPFQKAVFMMFLIGEVHPFSDGNGRTGRIMMNAELIHAGQARIIIPTIFRNNYLAALKALTHNAQPEPLIRTLDFAQKYTALIDWRDMKNARKMLMETNAFEDPNQADLLGFRLILKPFDGFY